MAFQTPVHNRDTSNKTPSLLFSPSPKPDGSKSGLGRAPSITPAFSTQPLQTTTRDHTNNTPPSRRRSVTPASTRAKDTPPPPPMGSLLDTTSAIPAPSLAGWSAPSDQHHSYHIDHDVAAAGAVSPLATAAAAAPSLFTLQSAAAHRQREYAMAERALRDYDSTWVTVFGFGQSDAPIVLREFGKCGDIVQFITEQPGSNWLNIQYTNKHAAQRALLRNGDQLSATCMVGVKGLDPEKIDALERQTGNTDRAVQRITIPKPSTIARPYHINASTVQPSIIPLPSKSAWEKVSEFILGM